MTCQETEANLSLLLYGELSFDEEEAVEQHLAECGACRGALERERAIHRAFTEAEAPLPAGLLVSCRRDLRVSLTDQAPAQKESLWKRLEAWFAPSAYLWKPAGAVALVALGFFGARFNSGRPLTMAGAPEPVASRVRYVEPDQQGNVQIVLEETRQRVMRGRPEDEAIQRLLLAAAKDPADPGLRAETVEVLSNRTGSSEVRRALLNALEFDNNAGVRLKALDGLKDHAGDPETRKVLTRVLLADDNPGVRTKAIDLLMQAGGAQRMTDPATVGALQELLRKEENNYIRLRTQRVLQEVNASPGVY